MQKMMTKTNDDKGLMNTWMNLNGRSETNEAKRTKPKRLESEMFQSEMNVGFKTNENLTL